MRARIKGGRAPGGAPAPRIGADAVLQLKISLRYAKPPIWRRLHFPAGATLATMHRIIQAGFDWDDSHLHQFEVGGERFTSNEVSQVLDHGSPPRDESQKRLRDVLTSIGDKIVYTYDFGDDWTHDVLLEEVLPGNGLRHAVCVAGRRSAPLEDCGGVWGWANLCVAMDDPSHPDHDDRRDWVDLVQGQEVFDPGRFDKDDLNTRLAAIHIR